MSIIILDTNVVSELMKPNPDRVVQAWMASLVNVTLATTVVTITEIAFGLSRLPSGTRRNGLFAAFRALAGEDGSLPVLQLTNAAAFAAGQMRAVGETSGFMATIADMMIAGIADFAGLAVVVVNPWAKP
jgi:toxin FitB